MVHHPVGCFLVDQRDMHGILPPERCRDGVAVDQQFYAALAAPFFIFAHAPRLVTLACAIGTGVRGVEKKPDLTTARGGVDLLCAQDKMPCPCFQAQAVEKRLFKAAFDATGKVIDQLDLVGLERTTQQARKLALGLRFRQLVTVYANPRTTTWGLGEDIGRNITVWAQRKPDELGTGPMLT
jgi:hypothetical protein